jgi:hypothetical protein
VHRPLGVRPDQVWHEPTGQQCCGTCKNGGKTQNVECTQPTDCQGMIHFMCVGGWSCEQNTCNWSCQTTVV